jgi:hypothetical protein
VIICKHGIKLICAPDVRIDDGWSAWARCFVSCLFCSQLFLIFEGKKFRVAVKQMINQNKTKETNKLKKQEKRKHKKHKQKEIY